MNRIGLLAAALVLGLGLWAVAHADEDTRAGAPGGPGWGSMQPMGPGMGYGRMGYGRMGYGRMHQAMSAVWGRLSREQREQLRKVRFETQHRVIARRADLQQARLTLVETMQRYPLDRKAAQDAFAKVAAARSEMFRTRLDAMAQVQQIVGQELWEEMHSQMGPGPMGPGMRGYGPGMTPGMMGPGPGMGPGTGR